MQQPTEEQRSFIRSYNRRRRWARFTLAALGAALLTAFFLPRRFEYRAWATAGFVFLLHYYFNAIRAKCPACGRFIGVSRWAQLGLPRGLRCDLEIACADALDEP
jgi:hypothetical protein